jgi:hypothetical protein
VYLIVKQANSYAETKVKNSTVIKATPGMNGKDATSKGISSSTLCMMFWAVTLKWTMRNHSTTDHFLGKLFFHKLAQDGSKHLQNFCILWIIIQKEHTSDHYCFESARQLVVLHGHFQSSACLNKKQAIMKHSVPR